MTDVIELSENSREKQLGNQHYSDESSLFG